MSDADYKQALPQGYELDKYRLLSVLGVGGFGVTYLAEHIALGHRVAIKEYLPNEFAVRDAHTVHPKSASEEEDFQWGLERFDEEARILTRFRHPNLVRISDYIKANNTAYIVMDYEEGEPLDKILARRWTLTEDQLRRVVLPIADGLRLVHAGGWLHRDIKPGNIYIRRSDETPVLLDFGAARQAIGSRSRSVHSVATAGYSPMEQYESEAEQGPWTDIYSLSAVCRKAITGVTPPEATRREGELLRGREDPLPNLSILVPSGYSKELLAAVDAGMRVVEDKRPQSIDEWLAILGKAPEPVAGVTVATGAEAKAEPPLSSSASAPERDKSGDRSRHSTGSPRRAGPSQTQREDSSPGGARPKKALAVLGALGAFVVAIAFLANLEQDGGTGGNSTPVPEVPEVGGTAMLSVESEPSGAEVLLGGEVIGRTPLRRTDLRPGDYDISIRLPNFESVQLGENSLREGRVLTLRETLRRGRGDLTVLVEPASAWVERDGARVADRTPITLENLAAGENFLTLGATGYRSEVVRVDVPMDGVGRLEHTLQVVPMGTLRLSLEPADAIVSLPDPLPDYRPGMRLPEGEYQISVSRDGFVEARRTINVSGDTVEQISLARREQPFTIAASPPHAEIEFIGRNNNYRDAMPLPPGEYRVRVSAIGYLTNERSIAHGESPTRAEIALERALQPFTVTLSPPDANVEFVGVNETYNPGGIALAPGEYRLRVTAPGHVTVEQNIVHGSEPTNLRIELPRELPAPGEQFRDCPNCPPMVALESDSFIMGCLDGDCSEDELPLRLVTFAERFALGVREVTVAEFRAFVTATGYQTAAERNPAQGCRTLELLERQRWEYTRGRSWRYLEYTVRDTQPVVCVNSSDAEAYVQWLAQTTGEPYRLPSESEWEYAARAGSQTRFFFGDNEAELCNYANIADETQLDEDFAWGNPAPCEDGNVFPADVASYRPNGFGLYDMHGNVFEWVADCRTPNYAQAPTDGTAAPSARGCAERIMRGGSWATSAGLNRSANRGFTSAEESGAYLGFRVARSLIP